MTDDERREQWRRSESIRESSSGMSDSDLRRSAYDSAQRGDVGATAGFLKALQDNKDNRNNSGCFITTAVCDNFGKSDDCYELTTFRNFRDKWLINQSDGKSLIDEYYEIAPKIVDKINHLTNAGEIYQSIWTKYLKPCLSFIENGDNQNCKTLYIDMVKNLREKFLG